MEIGCHDDTGENNIRYSIDIGMSLEDMIAQVLREQEQQNNAQTPPTAQQIITNQNNADFANDSLPASTRGVFRKYRALTIWGCVIVAFFIYGLFEYDFDIIFPSSILMIVTTIGVMIYAIIRHREVDRANKRADEAVKIKREALDIYRKADEMVNVVLEQKQSYPWLADLISSWSAADEERVAREMLRKKRPAIESARKVQEISREKRIIQKLCKQYEHQLHYYETVFPWLEEFKEIDPREAYNLISRSEGNDEYERLRHYLSPEEYSKLPTVEKYQRALDRYIARKKTNWEAGIDYERYIGYLFEKGGYAVQYVGAQYGLEDMGRDLIAVKEKTVLIVQCKRWAKDKTIHEKHIFQLYGSVVHWNVEHPDMKASGVFVASTNLSDVARKCANYLGIEIRENRQMSDYPLIKCHIGTQKKKIYHLPFDQQYDSTKINHADGDRYVSTVKEAERLGFRRAYRWKGTK